MADIAREAGVSIATVSRALNGRSGVSTATRRRIRRIAEDNRYQVSEEASALARGRTDRVAVVVPRIDSSVEAGVIAGLEKELRAAGMDVLLRCLDTPESRAAFLDTLPLRRKVDALVAVSLALRMSERSRLDAMGIPVVVVEGGSGTEAARVLLDILSGRERLLHRRPNARRPEEDPPQ